jgi:hypothetical protein
LEEERDRSRRESAASDAVSSRYGAHGDDTVERRSSVTEALVTKKKGIGDKRTSQIKVGSSGARPR